MSWFHGTVMCDLEVGEALTPAAEHGGYFANPRLMETNPIEVYDDGCIRHERGVVWLCEDRDEAQRWAEQPTLKMTGADVRRAFREVGSMNLIVYELEPVGAVYRRLDPHSPTEAACDKAVIVAKHVIERYDWRDWYERDDDGRVIDPYSGSVVELDTEEA